MADTIGLLRETPHQALVSLLNEYNGVDIHPDLVEFSNVQPISGRRTKVTVIPKRSVNPFEKNPYTGLKEIVYNRLDLHDFFSTYQLSFDLALPTSTHTVIEKIVLETGFVLEENEFELEFINPFNASPYRLKAKPDSLRWVGYVDIELVHRDPLNDIVQTTDLSTLHNPDSPAKRFVALDQFTTDGYLYGGLLKNVTDATLGDLNPEWLNRLLPDATGEWVREEGLTELNNLEGSHLVYNGYHQGYVSNRYNSFTTRTLAIELNPEVNNRYVGRLTIQYNTEKTTLPDTTPIQYRLPIELYQPHLNGFKVSNELVGYLTGDVITEVTDDWVIGRVVFNGDPWVVSETPGPFNAMGAKVLYNGFNNDYPDPPNPYLTHVLVLELSEYCTNFTGICYIYYNLRLVG